MTKSDGKYLFSGIVRLDLPLMNISGVSLQIKLPDSVRKLPEVTLLFPSAYTTN